MPSVGKEGLGLAISTIEKKGREGEVREEEREKKHDGRIFRENSRAHS